MVCSHDRGATMPEFLPSFCPYQNPDTHRSVVPLWNTRQSQLPCKTLERCPSAVRLHPSASLPRASTTSRGRRSTNDGRGTRPPTHGMSEHSSFDECSPRGRRAGRCAARAIARRAARVFHITVGVFGRGSGSMSAGDGRRVRRRSTSRCALRLDGCARKTRDTRRDRRDAPIRPSRASNRDSPPIPRF